MSDYKRLTKWEMSKGVKCVKYWQYSPEQIAERLALLEDKIEQGTLKEEKTCKNIAEMHPVDGFTCSECGISIEDYCEKEVDEENGDITYREYMLRYCPNCGAKVVEV